MGFARLVPADGVGIVACLQLGFCVCLVRLIEIIKGLVGVNLAWSRYELPVGMPLGLVRVRAVWLALGSPIWATV